MDLDKKNSFITTLGIKKDLKVLPNILISGMIFSNLRIITIPLSMPLF